MPTKLPGPLLQDALTRLSGWAGDDQLIHREYVLQGLARQRMIGAIEGLACSTDHVILVTDTTTGLDVSLATTDVDGVSEIDIAMASRLNDLFAEAATVPEPVPEPWESDPEPVDRDVVPVPQASSPGTTSQSTDGVWGE